jgi:DNA-binding CsgD family transcriptional regulator
MQSFVETARAEGQFFVSVVIGILLAQIRAAEDFARTRAKLEELRENARALGAIAWVAMAEIAITSLLFTTGDPGARAHLASAERVVEEAGILHLLSRWHQLAGALAMIDGEVAEAERRAHASLSLAHAHDYGWAVASAFEILAWVAASTASPVEAVRLLAAARRIRDERTLSSSEDPRVAPGLAALRETLGDESFETAWRDGYGLSFDEAFEYAQRARGERKRPAFGWESLTPTERLVVEQIEAGRSNPEIAQKLLMSRDTVKTHLSHIFTKLGVRNRSELAASAVRRSERE